MRSACSRPACLAALAGAVIGGCGSSRVTPVLPADAAARLHTYLAKVQASASAHNPAGARSDLDAFAGEVARENSAGHLTPAAYAALRTAITRTRARIAAEVTAPAPAAPVATPTVVSAPRVVPQALAPVSSSGGGGAKGKAKPPKPKGGGGKSKGKGPGKH